MHNSRLLNVGLHGVESGVWGIDDVVFVQEHWLTPDFLCRTNSITKDVVCFNTSSMGDAISGGVLVGRVVNPCS